MFSLQLQHHSASLSAQTPRVSGPSLRFANMDAAPSLSQLVESIVVLMDRYTIQMGMVMAVVSLLPFIFRVCFSNVVRRSQAGPHAPPAAMAPTTAHQPMMEALPDLLQKEPQQALPGALRGVLPALLQETMAPSALPETLKEVLPDLLKETLAARDQGSGDHSADASSVTLAVNTVKEVVNEALETKWKMLRQNIQVDTEQALKKIHDANVKQQGDKHKDLHQAMEAHKQQLDVLGQTVNQAGKTEQVRFQTLDGAVRGRVEVMETNVKARIDLMNNDLNDKITSVDTANARMEVYMAKLEGLVAKLEGLPKKLSDMLDMGKLEAAVVKLEALPKKLADATERIEVKTEQVRDRANSVQQDVNKLLGEVQQSARDQAGLTRRNTAAMESLQSAVASMGAALGQPPLDSLGMKELVDLTKDIGAQTASIAEAMAELNKEVRERGATTAGKHSSQQVPMQMPDPLQQTGGMMNQASPSMPAVIDLSSRIPARPQSRNVTWATVTLSSGKQVLVPEDDVLGLQPGPFMNMR